MDKEEIKKVLNDIIDSSDIHDFSVVNETIDVTTLDDEWQKLKLTGFTNIHITAYKGPK